VIRCSAHTGPCETFLCPTTAPGGKDYLRCVESGYMVWDNEAPGLKLHPGDSDPSPAHTEAP
jgi:hypothetical protein